MKLQIGGVHAHLLTRVTDDLAQSSASAPPSSGHPHPYTRADLERIVFPVFCTEIQPDLGDADVSPPECTRYCTVLYCAALYCTVLYYIVLY